jgi:serine/threonine protein kinase
MSHFRAHSELPKTTADYYTFGRVIGRGSFGKVYLCSQKLTGLNVAIKAIDRSYIKDERRR